MAEDDAGAEALGGIDGADASQLAAMIGQVTDEQLAEGMANPEGRRMVLDEIFKRMSEHAEPSQIQGIDASSTSRSRERRTGARTSTRR